MTLFIFIDEAGNTDFSTKEGATKWYQLTSLCTTNPYQLLEDYYRLRHELSCSGSGVDRFHATEDRQIVRDQFFNVAKRLIDVRVDSLSLEKAKLWPDYREVSKLYPFALNYLLKYVLAEPGLDHKRYDHIHVCMDQFKAPKKKREALQKGISTTLSKICDGVTYSTEFIDSRSHIFLQFVDYICWALYVKRMRNELRPYNEIKNFVFSDYEIFQRGTIKFY